MMFYIINYIIYQLYELTQLYYKQTGIGFEHNF